MRRVLVHQIRTLLEGIIALAHKLDYRVVAEGVETQEIYELMAGWQCDEAQGYYIARPLSPAMFEAWHLKASQEVI